MSKVIKDPRPWFNSKMTWWFGKYAPASVAAWTGTKSVSTQVTDTATAAQIGAALGQLIDDLRTAGYIK